MKLLVNLIGGIVVAITAAVLVGGAMHGLLYVAFGVIDLALLNAVCFSAGRLVYRRLLFFLIIHGLLVLWIWQAHE